MSNKNRLQIKGNRRGLNLIINLLEFKSIEEIVEAIKSFYSGHAMYVTTYPTRLNDQDKELLTNVLNSIVSLTQIEFEESNRKDDLPQIFNGVEEGQTKFVTKSMRGGQLVDFKGNVVVIGDVHIGAEILLF